MPPNGFNHPFSTCGKGSSKKIDLRFLSGLVNDGQHFLAFLEILFEILISNRYNWRIRSNGNHTKKNSAASRSDLKEIQERKLTPQWSNPRLLKPRWACNVCGFSHPKTQSLVENEPFWIIICILLIWKNRFSCICTSFLKTLIRLHSLLRLSWIMKPK